MSKIQFKLTITQRDVQPNIQTAASFSGRLVKNTLTGGLKWEGIVMNRIIRRFLQFIGCGAAD